MAAADQLTQAAEESTSLLSQRIKEHEATIGRLKIQLEQQARGGAHRHEVQVQMQQINMANVVVHQVFYILLLLNYHSYYCTVRSFSLKIAHIHALQKVFHIRYYSHINLFTVVLSFIIFCQS